MENELNYLSEKIQGLDDNITDLEMTLEKRFVFSRIAESYRQQIKEMKTEKTLLENILNRLSETELPCVIQQLQDKLNTLYLQKTS